VEAPLAQDDEALASVLPSEASEELETLIDRATVQAYEPGEVIIREGDRAETFFVLSEGAVEVVRGEGEERQRLALLEPGDHFGEIGLLGEGFRTATCIAAGRGRVRVLAISREDFMEIVEASDLVSDEIAAVARRRFVINRLRQAVPHADRAVLPQMLENAQVETVDPGRVVIRQGEPADAFYIILRGRVEVLHEGYQADAALLAELGEGQFFGETGLLHGRPRNATVQVASEESRPAELLAIDREAFLDLVNRSPSARRDIASVMSQRVLQTLHASGG